MGWKNLGHYIRALRMALHKKQELPLQNAFSFVSAANCYFVYPFYLVASCYLTVHCHIYMCFSFFPIEILSKLKNAK